MPNSPKSTTTRKPDHGTMNVCPEPAEALFFKEEKRGFGGLGANAVGTEIP